jgi:hypothetical protein
MYPAIQLGHATYALGYENGSEYAFDRENPTFCVLQVDDLDHLLAVERWLGFEDFEIDFFFETFYEPDHHAGKTAIAAGPILSPADRNKFKDFKLYHPPTLLEKFKFFLIRRLNKSHQ